MDIEQNTSDPGWIVEQATARVLTLASTWIAWDGRPRPAEDGSRIYTPHKVIRRYADHLIDHLAQIEAILGGVEPRPNGWHESRSRPMPTSRGSPRRTSSRRPSD